MAAAEDVPEVAARSKLGPELKRRFAEQGFSMSRVAKELGLFENSLRSWIRRNRFPDDVIAKLAAFAGLPNKLAALEEQFEFSVAGARKTARQRMADFLRGTGFGLAEAIEVINSRANEIAKGPDAFPEEVRVLFRALRKGDLYVHCAFDRFPYEAEGTGRSLCARELASAVGRGAHLLYLYPDRETLGRAHAAGLYGTPTLEAWEQVIGSLAERVAQDGGSEVQDEAAGKVVGMPCGAEGFFVPGLQFVLLVPSGKSSPPRLLLRLPLETPGTSRMVHLPLAEPVTGRFVDVVSGLLERSGHARLARLLG